ncbi:MAG TPA: lysylphosphatidylglycerol synthase transmembrane domain-containing protein [Chitinophagaceae bacterium]|nr:lysylphosphatidylglycerol synthase transmembrane domain-containing protein [Chitinophagaceae bacterium]
MFIKNKNIKILVNYGLGPVLFIWFSYAIYKQVSNQPHLQDALQNLKQSVTGAQSWKIYVALLLVPVNWGLEARKWQVLIKPVETISFFSAFKAVLAGLAFSMNTPNRIGEYGGRVLYVHEGHRWKAFSLTIIGSFSQLIITLAMGLGGLVFLLVNRVTAAGIAEYYIWIRVLLWGSILVTVFLVLLYFRLGQIIKWLEKLPKARSFLQHITVIEDLPVTILLRTISLSFIRYIIFVFQYILLLQLFAVETSVWHSFWLISVLYLILAITPTIALAEAGIRGQVSLLLFTLVSANKFGIVGAATAIWLINLVIPALVGSLLFLSLKIFSDK